MDINNIAKLAEKPYMVSWKADGTRYLMLIEKAGSIYFIDRDNCVFRVEGVTFPSKKNFDEHLYQTLVDGVSAPTFSASKSGHYYIDLLLCIA